MPDHGMDTPDGVSSSESPVTTENKKTCADCGTTKTPLWRGGPAGPKSLCNACGIRSRKKRRAVIGGLNKTSPEDKIKKPKKINDNTTSNHGGDNRKFKDPLKRGVLPFGRSVLMQKKSSNDERQRRKLGEVEQAAVLLMALSYGSVYA